MNSKDIYERFNELNINNKIICTDAELQDFLISGLVLNYGDKYVTMTNTKLDITVVELPSYDFDIDLSWLLSKEFLSKSKKIFCMTERCYNKYKESGLIITKGNEDFYRLYENELWLIHLI